MSFLPNTKGCPTHAPSRSSPVSLDYPFDELFHSSLSPTAPPPSKVYFSFTIEGWPPTEAAIKAATVATETLPSPTPAHTPSPNLIQWEPLHRYALLELASQPDVREHCLEVENIHRFAIALFEKYNADYLKDEDSVTKELIRLTNLYPNAFVDPNTAFLQEIQKKITKPTIYHPKSPWPPESKYTCWLYAHPKKGFKRSIQEIAFFLSCKFGKEFSADKVQNQLARLHSKLTS